MKKHRNCPPNLSFAQESGEILPRSPSFYYKNVAKISGKWQESSVSLCINLFLDVRPCPTLIDRVYNWDLVNFAKSVSDNRCK